jgi:hypothetical protein
MTWTEPERRYVEAGKGPSVGRGLEVESVSRTPREANDGP